MNGVPSKSPPNCKCAFPKEGPYCMGFQPICIHCNGVMLSKGYTMTASAGQHWVPDRNGLVQQGLIGDHMVRVTIDCITATHIKAGITPTYRVTIGLFHKYGNTSMNPRHREWTSRHHFSSAYKAWTYGERIVKGATQEGQNRR